MTCAVCHEKLSYYESFEMVDGKEIHAKCYHYLTGKKNRAKILHDINSERDRQNKLHPEKLALPMRFVTIMEEAGEVAEAMQDKDMRAVYNELIETAASCVRMAEEVLDDEVYRTRSIN